MNRTLFLAMGLVSMMYTAQQGNLGINTEPMNATLEIKVADVNANNDTNQGILIPKLSKTRVAAIADTKLTKGTLVYIDDFTYTTLPANSKVDNIVNEGFHFYDGNAWQPIQKPSPKFEYILSNDGSVLVQWMNKYKEIEIDMNNYPDMADVKVIDSNLMNSASIKKFIVKEGVTTIGANAFANNTNTQLVLPNSIEKIMESSFLYNTVIETIALPNLKQLGPSAFAYSKIKSIDIPELKEVPSSAFAFTTELTSVNLPKVEKVSDRAFAFSFQGGEPIHFTLNMPNVVTVGRSAFVERYTLTEINMPKLKTVDYQGFMNCSISDLDLPELIETKSYAFSQNNLTSLNAPKLEKIGAYSFSKGSKGSGLTNINLPSVKIIESNAFSYNTRLDVPVTVTLGPNISEIGMNAFSNINRYTEFTITIQATTPPKLTGLFLPQVDSPSLLTIRVPAASVQAYKTAWTGKVDTNRIVGY